MVLEFSLLYHWRQEGSKNKECFSIAFRLLSFCLFFSTNILFIERFFHSPWAAHNVCSFHCVYRLCNGACIKQTMSKNLPQLWLCLFFCVRTSPLYSYRLSFHNVSQQISVIMKMSQLYQTHTWGVYGNVTYKNILSLLLNLWTFKLTSISQPIMNWVLCSPVPLSRCFVDCPALSQQQGKGQYCRYPGA